MIIAIMDNNKPQVETFAQVEQVIRFSFRPSIVMKIHLIILLWVHRHLHSLETGIIFSGTCNQMNFNFKTRILHNLFSPRPTPFFLFSYYVQYDPLFPTLLNRANGYSFPSSAARLQWWKMAPSFLARLEKGIHFQGRTFLQPSFAFTVR